jgi:hypothetical protein
MPLPHRATVVVVEVVVVVVEAPDLNEVESVAAIGADDSRFVAETLDSIRIAGGPLHLVEAETDVVADAHGCDGAVRDCDLERIEPGSTVVIVTDVVPGHDDDVAADLLPDTASVAVRITGVDIGPKRRDDLKRRGEAVRHVVGVYEVECQIPVVVDEYAAMEFSEQFECERKIDRRGIVVVALIRSESGIGSGRPVGEEIDPMKCVIEREQQGAGIAGGRDGIAKRRDRRGRGRSGRRRRHRDVGPCESGHTASGQK